MLRFDAWRLGVGDAVERGRPPRLHQLTASLADDLILLTNRLHSKEASRTHEHLGPAPGGMESPFAIIPGQHQPLQSEPSSAMTPGQANILPPPTLAQAP